MSEKAAEPRGAPVSTTKGVSTLQLNPNKLRVLLFALPVLFGWSIILQRRYFSSTPSPLPSTYALCSSPHQIQIYTVNPKQPWVECIVVDDGLIAAVGSLAEVRAKWGDSQTLGAGIGEKGGIKVFRMQKGQMAMPGIIDSHAHLLAYGESQHAVDLVGAASVEEVRDRIAAFIDNHEDIKNDKNRFILGLGWDQTKWPGGQFPTAADLEIDPRLAGRPIYLKRIDVHARWVSQNVMDRMGSLPETVPGGLIVRDDSGEPTGVFMDNAMDLVNAVVPKWTDDDRTKFLTTAARAMLDSGITSAHDAALELEDIAFLRSVDEQGRLPVRIYGMTSCQPLNTYCGDEVDHYDGDRFVLRAVKAFLDGALGSWGALMHEPYSDEPSQRGILISAEEDFAPLVMKWIEKGFQVNSHAIGDRANTIVIDAYEQVEQSGRSVRELRLRNEHTQILNQRDIARMGQLGIISSVQPTHCTSDMGYAETRVGPERILGAYAWQSLQKSGSRLALGSDFPVEQVSPWLGIYSSVSRKWLDGDSPHGRGGWYADQVLSLEEAIRGFTLDGAFASFQENRTGSLEVGKEADFVVLGHNLFVVDESEIPHTQVKATVVGGTLFKGRLR